MRARMWAIAASSKETSGDIDLLLFPNCKAGIVIFQSLQYSPSHSHTCSSAIISGRSDNSKDRTLAPILFTKYGNIKGLLAREALSHR